ncbi:MAG: class I SAM-dependent methyltransferase [archaeon]
MKPPDKLIQTDKSERDEFGLFEKYADLREKKVIEIGCGYGKYTVRLAPLVKSISAIDMSEKELARAIAITPERLKSKIQYKHVSAADLPFADASFDTAFLAFVFHEIPHEEQEKALAEILRVLKPGGQAVLIDPTPYSPFHKFVRIFKPEEDHGWRVERSNARIVQAVEQGMFKKEQALEFHKTFEYESRDAAYTAILGNWARVATPKDNSEREVWKRKIDAILGDAIKQQPVRLYEHCQLITLRKLK